MDRILAHAADEQVTSIASRLMRWATWTWSWIAERCTRRLGSLDTSYLARHEADRLRDKLVNPFSTYDLARSASSVNTFVAEIVHCTLEERFDRAG
eukprot:877983-Amphidinium_carterae.1